MAYYTKQFCKNNVKSGVKQLEDAKDRLKNYTTRLDDYNLFYRDLDLFGSTYTNDILTEVKAAKKLIKTEIENLEVAPFIGEH